MWAESIHLMWPLQNTRVARNKKNMATLWKHFFSWKEITSVLFGFMKWRHSESLNISWMRLDWNSVNMMLGILFFCEKAKQNLFSHFPPIAVYLCVWFPPAFYFSRNLTVEMAMRSRKPAIWFDVYHTLTFSICSRGPVFTHFSTILPCWLRSDGKGYWEWKRNRKKVSDVGMGMILVSLLVCLLGQLVLDDTIE